MPSYSLRVRQLSTAGVFYNEYEVVSQLSTCWRQVFWIYAYVYALLPLAFFYPAQHWSFVAGFAGFAMAGTVPFVLRYFAKQNPISISDYQQYSNITELTGQFVTNGAEVRALSPQTQIVSNITSQGHDLQTVIARVYFAGLPEMPDCRLLDIQTSSDLVTSDDEKPVILTAKSSLGVAYMHNARNYMAMVSLGELKNTRLSMMRLHRIGMKNLASLIKSNPEQLKLRPYQSVNQLTFDNSYDASLILLDFLWDTTLRHLYSDAPVVTIPSRSTCAFCDSGSAEGLRDLQVFSQSITETGEHLLDPGLFIRNESGQWLRFEPPIPESI